MDYEKGKLYQLELARLITDPEQPRKYLDPARLAELQASIASYGVLQPILVRVNGPDGFTIVSGERRYQASLLAGCATIPAMVTDGEPAEIAIIENLLRENLTAIEEAEAIERLRAVHDYGLSELSAVLGKAESTLSETLSLNRLPLKVKDDCRKNPKTLRSILIIIARQKTPEKMVALYGKYRESGLTCGELNKQAAKMKLPKTLLSAEDIAGFSEKLDLFSTMALSSEQKAAINLELVKLRGVAYQKMKLCKV